MDFDFAPAAPETERHALADTTHEISRSSPLQRQHGYQVLARKYRPTTFDELLGQDVMVQTLTNAFKSNRIAQAYMLTGVRGVGKTTTARLIARALNYKRPGEPPQPTTDFSEPGEFCQAIMESTHVDVIEMDAASRTGINDVREIIESVRYKPVAAPYKVYIIDEIHMLSTQAFNALLKTLEEPPEHVKFVFATTEIRKVPVTVLSRCQRFDLRRFDSELLVSHFANIAEKEGVSAEPDALKAIARAARGSARDGLSLLDQAIAFGQQSVKAADVYNMLGLVDRGLAVELFEAVMTGDIKAALKHLNDQHNKGADPQTILDDFAGFVHWVTRIKVMPETADDAAYSDIERERGRKLAQQLSMPVLTRAWQMALKGLEETATAPNAFMAVEMVIIRLAFAADVPPPGDLVSKLKDNAAKGTATPSGRTAPPVSATPQAADSQPVVQLRSAAAPAPAVVVNERVDMPATPAVGDHSRSSEAISSFADIVALVGKMRDIKLKTSLERDVRPISVRDGKVEMALEKTAARGLAGELSRKLESWTGRRWMVLVAREGGETPLLRQRENARDNLFNEARENEVVKAVFDAFPGAEIVDVRTLVPQSEAIAATDDAEE